MRAILRSATTLLLLAPLCAQARAVASDAELEQRGARIGNIAIEVDDVFETGTGLAAPYRVANNLHITTHDSTVQQQLLFRTGDVFDRRLLDETARMLRAQRYLGEASVEPVAYHEADNTVDVLVRVHDVWTLSPGLSFGRKGGENSAKATFSAPGEYILRLQANDSTGEGGGGFQCCWTNAHVKVTVKAAATN